MNQDDILAMRLILNDTERNDQRVNNVKLRILADFRYMTKDIRQDLVDKMKEMCLELQKEVEDE